MQPQPLLLPTTTPLLAGGGVTSQVHGELGLFWECSQTAPFGKVPGEQKMGALVLSTGAGFDPALLRLELVLEDSQSCSSGTAAPWKGAQCGDHS